MSAGAVLLINPRMGTPRNAGLPLSILHLAAVLEGHRPWSILDGNLGLDVSRAALDRLSARPHALVGITVMPGPQVLPAIAISRAIRRAFPDVPIVWGGYFPTLYPDAALNAPYVDYVVRGQGEATLARCSIGWPTPVRRPRKLGARPLGDSRGRRPDLERGPPDGPQPGSAGGLARHAAAVPYERSPT